MSRYSDYIERGRRKYGDQFSDAALAPKFVPFFNNGARIKVRTAFGERTGIVSATTGWKPQFMLKYRANALGSTVLLSNRDEILAIRRGRHYHPIDRTYS